MPGSIFGFLQEYFVTATIVCGVTVGISVSLFLERMNRARLVIRDCRLKGGLWPFLDVRARVKNAGKRPAHVKKFRIRELGLELLRSVTVLPGGEEEPLDAWFVCPGAQKDRPGALTLEIYLHGRKAPFVAVIRTPEAGGRPCGHDAGAG